MADDKVFLGDGMPVKLVDLGDGGAGGFALATTAEITAELTTLETEIGAVNETAPATDTASSGLSGRLQRIAQRLTSIIALLPAALGQGTMAQSLRVVLASDQTPIPAGVPPLASVVLGANNGTGDQAVMDITDGSVAANKVFSGAIHISAAAQNPDSSAAGSLLVTVTWVPGTSGTVTHRVATVNLKLPITGVALDGVSQSMAISVPIIVYAGTTAGKFRATVTTTGTITAQAWDVVVSGTAQ